MLLLALALAAPASARAAREVSYATLLAQVRSGPLQRAVINRYGQDIEIKFRSGEEWKAPFPPGAQPRLQRVLRERHVRVIFATRPGAHAHRGTVHHHLRYIAAGVLAAALAIGGGLLAYSRRRRRSPLAPRRG
jgi:hypothetical protein